MGAQPGTMGASRSSRSSSSVLVMGLGLCVLGVGVNHMINGGLRDDNSFMGVLVKGVILLVGLVMVLLPIRSMMSSSERQRVHIRSLGRGVKHAAVAISQDFGSVASAAATVQRKVRRAIVEDDEVGAP